MLEEIEDLNQAIGKSRGTSTPKLMATRTGKSRTDAQMLKKTHHVWKSVPAPHTFQARPQTLSRAHWMYPMSIIFEISASYVQVILWPLR